MKAEGGRMKMRHAAPHFLSFILYPSSFILPPFSLKSLANPHNRNNHYVRIMWSFRHNPDDHWVQARLPGGRAVHIEWPKRRAKAD
jgi:hypothetical protein